MEFVEGNIGEEKVFRGVVFPKTFHPPSAYEEYGANELVEMVIAKREYLCEVLQRHSAILFRGFQVSSPKEFVRVVEGFGWEEMPYLGATSRITVDDRVHTANEAPLDQLINFHHEMSLIRQFPSKIFFFCSQPSPEGGETSIVPSHIIVEKMEERVPEFVTKVSTTGFLFRRTMANQFDSTKVISQSWKSLLETEDEIEAEKRAKEILECSSITFNEDGSANFVYGPMNPIKEFGGRKVWFNTILGSTSDEKDMNNMSFGDGSHLPAIALDAYKKIINENCVDIKWQQGDVLLVDNLCIQHARRPGKPPRVVLVSICK